MRRCNCLFMCFLVVLAVLTFGFFTPAAVASPFSWGFSGTGVYGGLVGSGVGFDGAEFQISLFGDTDNVDLLDPAGPIITAGLTGTVKVFGGDLSSTLLGSFVDPLYLYVNPGDESVGFGTGSNFDPIMGDTVDQLAYYAIGLGTYDLTTPLGPIGATSIFNGFEALIDFGGVFSDVLVFDTVDNGSFAAPVPEPATMLLLGSGLIGLAGFRRRLFKW